MNKNRRKAIESIIDNLMDLSSEIEGIINDEQDALDNIPESLQESERANTMRDAIEALEDANSSIREVLSSLSDSMA